MSEEAATYGFPDLGNTRHEPAWTQPSYDEQIAAISNAIEALQNGFTLRSGFSVGGLSDPRVEREIDALRAAIANLHRIEALDRALDPDDHDPEDNRPHW